MPTAKKSSTAKSFDRVAKRAGAKTAQTKAAKGAKGDAARISKANAIKDANVEVNATKATKSAKGPGSDDVRWTAATRARLKGALRPHPADEAPMTLAAAWKQLQTWGDASAKTHTFVVPGAWKARWDAMLTSMKQKAPPATLDWETEALRTESTSSGFCSSNSSKPSLRRHTSDSGEVTRPRMNGSRVGSHSFHRSILRFALDAVCPTRAQRDH